MFVKVTPDGKRVISNTGYILRMWDITTGKILQTIEGLPAYPGQTRPVECISITPDGKQAVVGAYRTIKVWNLADGKLVQLFDIKDFVTCMALTPDGNQAVTGSHRNSLKIWNVTNGHLQQTLSGHIGKVICVKVTHDGKQAISSAEDKTIKIWEIKSGKLIATYHLDSQATCIDISSDNSTILAGCRSGSLHKLTVIQPDK